jgi:hypothetical protein
VHGHTGANVYKGMVGLMPLYDPVVDNGDERRGLRLPGVRKDYGDGTFDVDSSRWCSTTAGWTTV